MAGPSRVGRWLVGRLRECLYPRLSAHLVTIAVDIQLPHHPLHLFCDAGWDHYVRNFGRRMFQRRVVAYKVNYRFERVVELTLLFGDAREAIRFKLKHPGR